MKRFAPLALAAALVGCATGGQMASLPQPKTPAQTLFELEVVFGAAVKAGVDYKNLPACGPKAPRICSNPAVVKKLQDGANGALAALLTAQAVMTAGKDPGQALKDAGAAVTALQALAAALPS